MKNFFKKLWDGIKKVATTVKETICKIFKKAKEGLDNFLDWCADHEMFTALAGTCIGTWVIIKWACSLAQYDSTEEIPAPTREDRLNEYIDAELWRARHQSETDHVDHMRNVRDAMLTLSSLKRMQEETEISKPEIIDIPDTISVEAV